MCLLDLALGSLYNFGPEKKQNTEHRNKTAAVATTEKDPPLYFYSSDKSCMKI